MGNTCGCQESINENRQQKFQNWEKKFQADYHKLDYSKHPTFGVVQIFDNNLMGEDQHNKQVGQVELFFDNKDQVDEFLSQTNGSVRSFKSNVCNVFGAKSSQENLLQVDVFFQWVNHDLQEILNEMRNDNTFFEEKKLWEMLKLIVEALVQFQDYNIMHGDIRSVNIGWDDEERVFLWPNYVLTGNNTNLDYAFQGYFIPNLSPEQLQIIRESEFGSIGDDLQVESLITERNQIWSLGILFLELASLYNPKNFYDQEQYTLNRPVMEQALQFVYKKYQEPFYNLIDQMLTHDPISRISLNSLLTKVYQFYQTQSYQSEDEQSLESRYTPTKNIYERNSPLNKSNKKEKGRLDEEKLQKKLFM